MTPYQRRLIGFLSVACFFEGYDFFALAQILPKLRADFGLSPLAAGVLLAVVNVGTMVAAVLVRQADRIGRKRVLTITIAGYTVFSLLTAAAPDVWFFGATQLVARIFLIAEWAVSMMYAAEEFPAERRGFVIGVIQAFSSFGAIACAALVPMLVATSLGWRAVYLVGAIPLVLVAFARRGLQESTRFAAAAPAPARAPLAILAGPYRNRVLLVAAIWALTYVNTQNAITFWKEFAVGERGLTDGQVGLALTIGAVGSLPLLFLSGKFLDAVGRRPGALVIFGLCALGTFGAYTLDDRWALTASLAFGIFGTSAVLPVLNAYTTELFPTNVRGDAFALANNLLGRVGYVLSPIAVGWAAGHFGWGPAVATTAVFPLLAVALIWFFLPETRGLELEETCRT